ncbi:ATP-binding cassette domain-containing protein [Nonomuraea ferruginea]
MLFGLGAIQLAAQPNGLLAAQSKAARHRRDRKRAELTATAASTAVAAEAAEEPPLTVREPDAAPATAAAGAAAGTAAGNGGGSGLLELDGVRAAYGEVEVLHGIDLAVREGTILALLGANGSGKTTLCSAIAGLVPATGGRIVFDGEDITALGALERVERGLVLVPESRGVFPSITVDENLSIWLPSKADRAKVYEQFESLARRAGQPAGNLSGGEQQMLSLAPLPRAPAAPAHQRRAVARAGAARHGGDHGRLPAPPAGGHHCGARRGEGSGRPHRRRPGRRAPDRPPPLGERPVGGRRAAGRRRLSRHVGRRALTPPHG